MPPAPQAEQTSEYRNVCWHKPSRRWIVKIHMRGHFSGRQIINVAYYDDEHYAARVADLAEVAVRGCALGPRNLPDDPIEGAERTEILLGLRDQHAITPERFDQLLS